MNNRRNYNKNSKLNHLTDEQIEEIINRYYDNEKISNLIEEYNIDIIASRLYTILPPLVCEDKICPNCNMPLVKDRKSRTGYSNREYSYCPICKHSDGICCDCPSCDKQREKEKSEREEEEKLEIIRKRELINSFYSFDRFEPVKLEELSFRDKVYIGALLRFCLSEDFSIINSLNNVEGELAPTNELKREIVTALSHKNIIVVHPNSPIEAFAESNENPFPKNYYIYYVNYHLNIVFLEDRQKSINDLINPSDFDKTNSEEAFNIWRDLALAECLEYLNYQMHKVKFDFTPGKKTITVFNDLLDNFSVSQIYGIIYRSVSNATRFYQENNIPKKQAANTVIGGCQRYAEQVLINKWDIKKFNRNFDLPQSMISEFLFNRVLKIGNLGFDMPPTML